VANRDVLHFDKPHAQACITLDSLWPLSSRVDEKKVRSLSRPNPFAPLEPAPQSIRKRPWSLSTIRGHPHEPPHEAPGLQSPFSQLRSRYKLRLPRDRDTRLHI